MLLVLITSNLHPPNPPGDVMPNWGALSSIGRFFYVLFFDVFGAGCGSRCQPSGD